MLGNGKLVVASENKLISRINSKVNKILHIFLYKLFFLILQLPNQKAKRIDPNSGIMKTKNPSYDVLNFKVLMFWKLFNASLLSENRFIRN